MPKHESVFFAVERPRDKLETLPLHQPDFEAVTVDVSEKIAFILYEGSEVVSVSVRKELPEPSAEALELVVVDDDVRRVAWKKVLKAENLGYELSQMTNIIRAMVKRLQN